MPAILSELHLQPAIDRSSSHNSDSNDSSDSSSSNEGELFDPEFKEDAPTPGRYERSWSWPLDSCQRERLERRENEGFDRLIPLHQELLNRLKIAIAGVSNTLTGHVTAAFPFIVLGMPSRNSVYTLLNGLRVGLCFLLLLLWFIVRNIIRLLMALLIGIPVSIARSRICQLSLVILLYHVSVNLYHYNQIDATPAFLFGWSTDCKPTWLASDPDTILLGYPRLYPDLRPPFASYHPSYLKFKKCWHADKNFNHQENGLNLSFPISRGGYADVKNNRAIMRRGELAFESFHACLGFPCFYPASNKATYQTPSDGLPSLPSPDQCPPCRIRDGLWNATRAALIPFSASSITVPSKDISVESYCPCSLRSAVEDKYMFLINLPEPRSIHPFYTNPESTLVRRASTEWFSYAVYLYGNDFFVPWRKTSIGSMSREELMDLYVKGWWDNQIGGADLPMGEVRKRRGVKLTKKEKEKIYQRCKAVEGHGERLHTFCLKNFGNM